MERKKLKLAGCVVCNDAGEVLLLHRNTERRVQWETPGGRIEGDKPTAEEAARETSEEIGVEVEIIKRLGTRDFEEEEITLEYTWYLARIPRGEAQLVELERYDELRYFSWDELLKYQEGLSPNVQNLLEEYISGRIELY